MAVIPAPRLTRRQLAGWLSPERLALAAVLVVGLAARLRALGGVPRALWPEEARGAEEALRILAGAGPPGGLLGMDWQPAPALMAYVRALAALLLGAGPLALRLPSALLGALLLLPAYALLRRQVAWPAALAALLLLATHPWLLHASRSAWGPGDAGLFVAAALWLLLRAADALGRAPEPPATPASDSEGRAEMPAALPAQAPAGRRAWALFALAGGAAALALYTAQVGWLGVVTLVAAGLGLVWRGRARAAALARGVGLAVAVALALSAPMLPAALADWGRYTAAPAALSDRPEYREDPLMTLRRQVGRSLMVLWDGQLNTQPGTFTPGEPWLDWPIRLLVLAGIYLTLRRGGEARLVWWSWLAPAWLLTQVLRWGAPDWASATFFAPALLALAAAPLDSALAWARPRPWALGAGALAVAWLASAQLGSYTAWQSAGAPLPQSAVSIDAFPAWAAQVRAAAVAGAPRAAAPASAVGQAASGVTPVPLPTAEPAAPPAEPAKAGAWPPQALAIEGLGLVAPRAALVGPGDQIYVLDAAPDVQAVKVFDADGHLLRSWGGPGGADESGRFVEVSTMALDQQGQLLVLDAETGWVTVFDPEGHVLRRWGGPALGLYKARAMAIGPSGKVYIADTGGKRVVSFTPEGLPQDTFGRDGPEEDRLVEPSGVAVAPDESVVVADAGRGVVRHYAADGRLAASWPVPKTAALDGPRAAVGPDSSLYLTNPDACQVVRSTLDGAPLASSPICGQDGALRRPGSLAVAPDGRLVVADLQGDRVVIYKAP